jgi:transcriptional regulator with XRE-family HTH domain
MKIFNMEEEQTRVKSLMKLNRFTRDDLYEIIKQKYPNKPLSKDSITRIANGQRKNYSISTLLRICSAFNVSPDMIVDNWEEVVWKNI